MSCADPTFCVAVGTDGKAATFNGAHWSTPTSLGNGAPLASVSCPTDTFCVAIDYSGAASTFDGAHWSNGTTPSGAGATEVSCPSAASASPPGSTTAAGTAPAGRAVAGPQHHDSLALSCPDQPSCVLLNATGAIGGQAMVWDGSPSGACRWTTRPAGTTSARDISCPTTDFCMQVNGFTSAYRLDG